MYFDLSARITTQSAVIYSASSQVGVVAAGSGGGSEGSGVEVAKNIQYQVMMGEILFL